MYEGWRRYYRQEPFGPWRDNMHAAIIAREIRRGHRVRGAIKLEQFLMKLPEERQGEANQSFLGLMRTVAVRRPLSERKAKKKKKP